MCIDIPDPDEYGMYHKYGVYDKVEEESQQTSRKISSDLKRRFFRSERKIIPDGMSLTPEQTDRLIAIFKPRNSQCARM